MKDRTNEEGIDPVTDGPTDNARRRGESESCYGGKHGVPQERTMIEQILEPDNLAQAWQRVKANKGAPGIDGMTVEDFPAFAREHWPRIATAIRNETYHPAPVRRVFIPKPDGTQRPLGIPTVLDRVIQQAVAQTLGPLFEADFSEHSYGYRPGRSAHMAVAAMESGWKEGRRHAVECQEKRRKLHYASRGKLIGGEHPFKAANRIFFTEKSSPSNDPAHPVRTGGATPLAE